MVDPVAWQVKDYADGWIVFAELRHAEARASAMGGALIRPLYPAPPAQPTCKENGEKLTGQGWRLLPLDDPFRSVSDSLLPREMIRAGEHVLEQADDDHANYVPGETTDWDYGMEAVAVYRAMTAAAIAPAPPDDGAERVHAGSGAQAEHRDEPSTVISRERLVNLIDDTIHNRLADDGTVRDIAECVADALLKEITNGD